MHSAGSTGRSRVRSRSSAATLALLALIACAPARAPLPTAPALPAAPALRVGTSGDYPPFSTRAADGTLAGFDVEVARAYARDRGRSVEFVPFRWPELRARLGAGEFDVAMSGVTVRADRLVTGFMTAAVARADAVLLVRASDGVMHPTRTQRVSGTRYIATLARIDRPERTVAVNRGGHLERVARARLRHAAIMTVDDNRHLPDLLRQGNVDAIVTDTLEAATFAAGTSFAIAERLGRDRKAYWVAPGQAELAADLDAWLGARDEDGFLPALRARHLGSEALSPLPSAVDHVVDLVARRLALMPAVAAAKTAAGLPIEDRTREIAVERGAAARARAAGLDARAYLALVRAEIMAAKAVQRASARETAAGAAPPLVELRAAIDRLDAMIVAGLARVTPAAVSLSAVVAALLDDTDLPGLNPALRARLAGAIVDAFKGRPGQRAGVARNPP